jgi:hypothetical protein
MDDWLKPSALRNQVKFLLVDLDAALTFLDIAKTTSDEEIRQRNYQNALHAYDTVCQLRKKAKLNKEQNKAIRKKLILFKTRLGALEQRF